jgi:hypothetical protein
MKLAVALLCAIAAASAQNNLVDTFVSTFTGTSTDEGRDLVDLFEKCGPPSEDSVAVRLLRNGINATRTCSNEISRDHAKKCLERSSVFASLATSPYSVLAMQKLDASDIEHLGKCASGLDVATSDEIVDSMLVIMKRFVNCALAKSDLTAEQEKAILDVFDGTDQRHEINRALLSNLCNSLHFSGRAHEDLVDFITTTFKSYVVLLPTRRI